MNVIIYGKDKCSFCDKAKKWFESRDISYEYRKIDESELYYEMFCNLFESKEKKTVPQIIIDNKHIKGYDELLKSNIAFEIDTKSLFD